MTSVAKTGRLVVVDEACQTCGAAAEIISLIVEDRVMFSKLKSPPRRVCGLDVPIPLAHRWSNMHCPSEKKSLPQ